MANFVGNIGDPIYFPDDNRPWWRPVEGVRAPQPQPIGIDNYVVDDVIAHGVTNLCLSLDRAVAEAEKNSDYHVYSPLSVASK